MMKPRTLLSIGSIGFLSAVALASLGCSKDEASIDIGENVGAKLTDYAANWEGYVEAYAFSDGSDRVRLSLSGDGHGKLRVGELALFPPPTDPNVGYPATAGDDTGPLNPLKFLPYAKFSVGFEYSVLQPQVQDNRIRLSVDINELYSAWCQLQTPYLDDVSSTPPAYYCSHNWGLSLNGTGTVCTQTNPVTLEQSPIDCHKAALCSSNLICACTATSCATPPVTGTPSVQIDGALEQAGAQLVGTLVIDGSTRVNIRLVRK